VSGDAKAGIEAPGLQIEVWIVCHLTVTRGVTPCVDPSAESRHFDNKKPVENQRVIFYLVGWRHSN